MSGAARVVLGLLVAMDLVLAAALVVTTRGTSSTATVETATQPVVVTNQDVPAHDVDTGNVRVLHSMLAIEQVPRDLVPLFAYSSIRQIYARARSCPGRLMTYETLYDRVPIVEGMLECTRRS
jgi:hypothetical protein